MVAITRCIKIEDCQRAYFHFKGFIKGEKCSMIKVSHDFVLFDKGEDYILKLNVQRISNGVLNAELLSGEKISDIRSIF